MVIEIPPLEVCLEDEGSRGLSMIQMRATSITTAGGSLVEDEAPGSAEEATWDLYSTRDPGDLLLYHNFDLRSLEGRRSERSSIWTFHCAADSVNAEARNAVIGRSQVQTFQQDPMEGLPDPGNPAILQLDTLLPEEETSKVNMQLQIEPEWAELWKLFKPWHFELIIDIPREAMPVPLALQYLSGCKIGIQNCQKLHLFTDGSYNPGAEVASFAIVIIGSNPDSTNRYFGGWFGGILQLDATNPNYTGARQASASEAEISALLWAHLWLIQQNFQGHVDICYDSLVAGHGAAGRWKCDASWTHSMIPCNNAAPGIKT